MRRLLDGQSFTYTQIAQKTESSVSTVAFYAERWGLGTSKEKARKRGQLMKDAVQKYGQAGAARRFGISRQAVHRYLLKFPSKS